MAMVESSSSMPVQQNNPNSLPVLLGSAWVPHGTQCPVQFAGNAPWCNLPPGWSIAVVPMAMRETVPTMGNQNNSFSTCDKDVSFDDSLRSRASTKSSTTSAEDISRSAQKHLQVGTCAKEELGEKARSDKKSFAGRCERLMARADFAQWSVLPKWINDSVWSLACSASGSRLLQKVVQECRMSVQVQVADRLRGRVWEASVSREANYVVQACIEVLPSNRVQFVVNEMKGRTVQAAQNTHASRVLEKVLEQVSHEQTAPLIDELTKNTHVLCRHSSGNFLLQHILKYGTQNQQSALVKCLVEQGANSLARHKVGNHVISCALVIPNLEIIQVLVDALVPGLSDLSHHHSGSFVARELKRVLKMN